MEVEKTVYGTSASSGSIILATGENPSSIGVGKTVDISVATYTKNELGDILYTTTVAYPDVTVLSRGINNITVNNTAISVTSANGYIEILTKDEAKPDHIIGGYVITAPDGTSYHYALPVYDYGLKS